MPRNRTIYQSEAVYVGPTGQNFSSGNSGVNFLSQLHRVQTFNSSLSLNHTDVLQLGGLAAIDRPIVDAPTVPIDMSWYITDGWNESGVGLNVNNTSAISNILTKTNDEHCYYLLTVGEGIDATASNPATDSANHFVTAIGNAFITNYTAEASVGGFATATVSAEGQNIRVYQGSTGKISPQVDSTNGSIGSNKFSIPLATTGNAGMPIALRAGDITMRIPSGAAFGAITSGNGACHLQSFSLSVPLARENINRLGSKYAFSKEVTVPVVVSLNVSAIASDLQNAFLDDFLCSEVEKDITIELREPSCNTSGPLAVVYQLKGCRLDSTNYTTSIGPNKTVDFVLSTTIGSSGDNAHALLLSGSI